MGSTNGGGGDMAWVGKRPARRLGGMADVLTMAADLGFPVSLGEQNRAIHSLLEEGTLHPKQPYWCLDNSNNGHPIRTHKFLVLTSRCHGSAEESILSNLFQQDGGFRVDQESEGGAGDGGKGKGASEEALVRVLRELATVQRNLANLQVELQGRQDDERVAHLTHVSEIKKKSEALAKTTATLQDVIHNKDRIIARLQQPYSLDCIPVETEYQRQFSELLLKAAGDYGSLTAATADIQWTQNFKEPPLVWGELLRPIPTALAACTRYYEALSAMRDAVAALHQARVRGPMTPMKQIKDFEGIECLTPPTWHMPVEEPSSDDVLMRSRRQLQMTSQEWAVGIADPTTQSDQQFLENMKPRRMSWPPSPNAGAVL